MGLKKESITKNTRKESYERTIENLGEKQKLVLEHLSNTFSNGATAKEIAVSMFFLKLVSSPERNSVHPRLNELVSKGLVDVIGSKSCGYTDRKVAIYKSK